MGMFSSLIIYNNISLASLSLTDVPIKNKKFAVKMNKAKKWQICRAESKIWK